jgi:Tol biopolymer transport system component
MPPRTGLLIALALFTVLVIGCSSSLEKNGRIAFSSNRDGNTQIYVMDADGSNQTRLTSNSDIDWAPAWSPDGSKIAFTSTPGRDGKWEIYVMDADGSNQTRLTGHPADMLAGLPSSDIRAIASDTHPSWGPAR